MHRVVEIGNNDGRDGREEKKKKRVKKAREDKKKNFHFILKNLSVFAISTQATTSSTMRNFFLLKPFL